MTVLNPVLLVLDQSPAEKIEALKRKIEEAHQTIQLKRKESKENIERHSKAEWAISLCNKRVRLRRFIVLLLCIALMITFSKCHLILSR